MSVNKPILLAKAMGIKNFFVEILALLAILTTIGSITATVPVLLTKAPINAVTSITKINNLLSLFPANRKIRLLIILANPVRKIPPPTINNPIIMMTTEFENPESASAGVSISVSIKANSAHKATRSDRTFPLMKNIEDTINIIIVVFSGVKNDDNIK